MRKDGHEISPARRCFENTRVKLSDFFIKAEQKVDVFYRKNIISASTMLPIFTITLTSMLRMYHDNNDKAYCSGNPLGSPSFFCLLMVAGIVAVHVFISVTLLFMKSYRNLRGRMAAIQIFPVLGSGLMALIVISLCFVIYYLVDYDFKSFEAPKKPERYTTFVFFTSATIQVMVCYNRLLAFYSMNRVFTASWTMSVILVVCLTSVLDYVRSLSPEGPGKTCQLAVVILLRAMLMISTLWKNLICLVILARERNWSRFPIVVKVATCFCGWTDWCAPAMNLNAREEEEELEKQYGELEGTDSDEGISNRKGASPVAGIDGASDVFTLEMPGGPAFFGPDDLDSPATEMTNWTNGSAGGREGIDHSLGEDIQPKDYNSTMVSRASTLLTVKEHEAHNETDLPEVSPLDGLAITVTLISTLNILFFIFAYPMGMRADENDGDYTLCDRVNANLLYASVMLILQHRVCVLYVREVDLDFLGYQRDFRDVSKDLILLLSNLVPDDIKDRMMERMRAVLQGDSSAEDSLPDLSQNALSEQEISLELHKEDIEVSCSDISLISQMQSSVFGSCMHSSLAQTKISSDKIVFRFNASLLETSKLTI